MNQRIRSLPFWTLAMTGTACMVLAVRYLVCVPVDVFVRSDPEQLFADPSSSVAVTVSEHNRLGFPTPFHREKLRCRLEEGEELCVLEYVDDSTRVIVRSTGIPGDIAMVIVTEASRFPLYLHLTVQPLLVTASGQDPFFPNRPLRPVSQDNRARDTAADCSRYGENFYA